MRKLTLGVFVVAIMLTSSCATILTGRKQKITFKSNVDGKVIQNLSEIGKTNEVIKVYRRDLTKLYTIKSDGCPDKQFELPVRSNHVFLLNLLTGLWIGGYFDLMYGSNMITDKVIDVNVDCKEKSK